jgi:predicted aldo/keto reductase-like oxidoreductase
MAYDLPVTLLGRTRLCVTRLGIGGAYCDNVRGYQTALDYGANLVDTARAYRDGKDEEIIGQAIAGRRDGLVLASKTLERDGAAARRDLETSLRLLGTDFLDVWYLHHLNTAEHRKRAFASGGALEVAIKAREQGLVRFIGVTGHDWSEVGKAVATGQFDVVLCWYNCAMKEAEQLVFSEASVQGTGVVVMNASRNDKLFAGAGAPPPVDLYRYVLSCSAVHATVMGLRNVELFGQVAKGLAECATLSPERRGELEEYGARLRGAGLLGVGRP